MQTIRIGNKEINEHSPCLIIAELSCNHQQDFQKAKDTIKAIAETGADAVKLQTYTPETITFNGKSDNFRINGGLWNGKSLYELYQEAYTPWEWHTDLFEYARKLGLICFSSPFDYSAVDLLESLDTPAYKVASLEITDIPLIEYIAQKGKPVILSTGIANMDDIRKAINACYKHNNQQVIVLKCVSGYPTSLEQVNLKTLPDIYNHFSVYAGLSDHTLGTTIPIAATALGAKLIEKHFVLNREDGSLDSAFSLQPSEFKEMVISIRTVEKAMGEVNYELTDAMLKSRKHSRSLFIVKDIKKDELFTMENIRSIRPADGLSPEYLPNILGKVALVNLKEGTPLQKEYVKDL